MERSQHPSMNNSETEGTSSAEQHSDQKKVLLYDQYGKPLIPAEESKKAEFVDVQGRPLTSSTESPDSKVITEVWEPSREKSATSQSNPEVTPSIKTEKQETPEEARERIKREIKEISKKITFVDVGHLADAEARDVAEERLTEEREKTKGLKNIFKRIWKHNIAREYYRQGEIKKAKGEIYGKENIYAGEESDKTYHDDAMRAVTERFLEETDGVIREASGERKQTLSESDRASGDRVAALKGNIKDLIHDYAKGEIDGEAFEEERTRLLSQVTSLGKGVVDEGKMYADNLKSVAEQIKQAFNNGVALGELDLDFDLSIGRAVSGVRTEANHNNVDHVINKLQKTLPGTLLANETTAAAAVSIVSSIATSGTRGLAKAFGWFGGVAVAGGMAAYRENNRLKMERAQHQRQMAKGKVIGENSPRRQRMEAFQYETKDASALTKDLLNGLYLDGNPQKGIRSFATQEDLAPVLRIIADIESRINLSNTQKIDLISFSNVRSVEVERSKLEIELARAKAQMKKANFPSLFEGKTVNETIQTTSKVLENSLEKKVKEKNRLFNKMKAKRVALAAGKGALTGLVVGGIAQEIHGALDHSTQSLIGNDPGAHHETPLEKVREWLMGSRGSGAEHAGELLPVGNHDIVIDGDHFRFPEGTDITSNQDGTITIIAGGKTIADHIPFEFGPDGSPTPETLAALNEAHIVSAGEHTVPIATTVEGEVSLDEYITQHQGDVHEIKRDLWYDNDTATPFDKNELRTHWGGEQGTGIDANGNYVLNVSHMTTDGSYHGQFSADAKALVERGDMKLLLSLSKGTQNQVFEVPIDTNGNAVIDPQSDIGKIFFSTENGKAVFNGQYGEIAQMMGDVDGKEHVRVLGTLVGDGIETVKGSIPGVTDETIRDFTFPGPGEAIAARDVNTPWVIPAVGRRPLEPVTDRALEQTRAEQPIAAPLQNAATERPSVAERARNDREDRDIPPGGFMAPTEDGQVEVEAEKGSAAPEESKKESTLISPEEYQALRDDLEFINKKIQSHEGIITVDESDLKSDYAKKLYRDKKDIPDGKGITFNQSELRDIGDGLERALTKSKVAKTADEMFRVILGRGLPAKQYENLKGDMEAILTWDQEGRSALTFDEKKLKTSYGKQLLEEIRAKREQPEIYKVRENYRSLLSKVKITSK